MKKSYIRFLLLLTLWAALFTNNAAFAQKNPESIGDPQGSIPVPTVPTPYTAQTALSFVQVEQPAPMRVPAAVIVSGANIRIQGRAGTKTPNLDGFRINVQGASEAIDGFVVMRGTKPIGPLIQADRREIICSRVWFSDGETDTFSIGVLTKTYLGDFGDSTFSVSIVGVITETPLEGNPGVQGPAHSLNLSLQVGRSRLVSGTMGNTTIFPLVSRQYVMDLHFGADQIEPQDATLLTLEAVGEGGRMDDIEIGLFTPDGEILTGRHQMEASVVYGQGTVKFYNTLTAGKSTLARALVGIRMGDSWKNGGSISITVNTSKCMARGHQSNYTTLPYPRTVLAGQVFTVMPVSHGESFAWRQIPIFKQLGVGRNDLAITAITAPSNRALALSSLGLVLMWNHPPDRPNAINMHGFTDPAFTSPIPSLPNGAFSVENQNTDKKPILVDSGFQVEDRWGDRSAVIVPPSSTWYFVMRGDSAQVTAGANLIAALFNPATIDVLAIQSFMK